MHLPLLLLIVAVATAVAACPPPPSGHVYVCHHVAGGALTKKLIAAGNLEEYRGHYGDFLPGEEHEGVLYDCECVAENAGHPPSPPDPRDVDECDCPTKYGCAVICHYNNQTQMWERQEPTKSEALELFDMNPNDFCAGERFNDSYFDCYCNPRPPPPPPPCDLVGEEVCLEPEIEQLPGGGLVNVTCCVNATLLAEVCQAGHEAEAVLDAALDCNVTVIEPPPCQPEPPGPPEIIRECNLTSCGGVCPETPEEAVSAFGTLTWVGVTTGVTVTLGFVAATRGRFAF